MKPTSQLVTRKQVREKVFGDLTNVAPNPVTRSQRGISRSKWPQKQIQPEIEGGSLLSQSTPFPAESEALLKTPEFVPTPAKAKQALELNLKGPESTAGESANPVTPNVRGGCYTQLTKDSSALRDLQSTLPAGSNLNARRKDIVSYFFKIVKISRENSTLIYPQI